MDLNFVAVVVTTNPIDNSAIAKEVRGYFECSLVGPTAN
jgi:hypothetical protein